MEKTRNNRIDEETGSVILNKNDTGYIFLIRIFDIKITIAKTGRETTVSKVTASRALSNPSIVQEKETKTIKTLISSRDGSPVVSWSGTPLEIAGLKAGIMGLGKAGGMIAGAFRFFGAAISCLARSGKDESRKKVN